MAEAFNVVYRLFAPLLVVVVIIAGVDLSSGLIKNSQKKQTAITIAYAGACAAGVTPVSPTTCPSRDKKGQCLPTKCVASANGTIVTGFWTPSECCLGNNWAGAESATAKGGQAVLGEMMKSVMEFFKPKPGGGGATDTRPALPVCQSLAVSPTLPLEPGESATLTWTLGGGKADTIVVSPGVGAVVGFSTRVSPRSSTTYTVTATNERGSAECSKVRVYVGPRGDADEGIFTDDTSTSNSGDVDVWNTGGDNTGARNATNSAYDDIWNGGAQQNSTTQDDTNDGQDYYDFLSSLAEGDSEPVNTEQNVDYSEYYYGDGGDGTFDWNDFGGEEPSWDNVDLQEGYIGESDINGLDLGARENNYYNEYDGGVLAQNSNGLTNEEIYGVWNRPQSPATGGLGLSGGFGGASNAPVDLSAPTESVSIFGRIGRWFKNTFCFWCNNAAYGNSSQDQVVAAVSFAQKKDKVLPSTRNSKRVDAVMEDIEPIVIKPPVWKGKSIKVRVVDIGRDSKVLEREGVKYGITYSVGKESKYAFLVRHTKEYPVVEIRFKNNQYMSDRQGGNGISEYVQCKDSDTITLYGDNVLKKDKVGEIKKIFDSVGSGEERSSERKPIVLKNGEITKDSYYGYMLICGNPKKGEGDMKGNNKTWDGYACNPKTGGADSSSKTHVLKDGRCIKKTTDSPAVTKKEVVCKPFYKTGEKRPGHCKKEQTRPKEQNSVPENKRHQAEIKKCEAKGGRLEQSGPNSYKCIRVKGVPNGFNQRPTPQEVCARAGQVYKGVNPNTGQHQCAREQVGQSKRERTLQAQLRSERERRASDARKASEERRKLQAQMSRSSQAAKAAAQRSQQRKPSAQRPQQRPPQQEPSWLQALLAKLRGDKPQFPDIVVKPQCLSFTSDKLAINGGEEVILQWAVTGATKIIITPKVTVVEIDDGAGGKKKVAKANPESDVLYTLIATNDKGEEHRCQTKKIVVDGGNDVASLTCDTKIDRVKIAISPDNVERPACDPEVTGEQCNEDWQGETVEVEWEVEPSQCVTSCKISNQDGDIWTSSSDMKHELSSGSENDNKYGNEGSLRESSTFKIKCEDAFGNLEEDEASAVVREL